MNQERILIPASAVFLLIFLYLALAVPMLSPVIRLPAPGPHPTSLATVALLGFSLLHAAATLGWRHTAIFFVLSAGVSWGYEQVGVATGAIYGAYHYTEALGAKLGHVPLLIPLAWFMMIYPSYVLANLIADGRPAGTRGGLLRVGWLALLSALIMTAWDLAMDPVMSGYGMSAWVWETGGPYFGVPLQNFAGWVLTTFTVYLLYRFYEWRFPERPIVMVGIFATSLPVLAYAAMMVAYMRGSSPPELHLITLFVMGIPVLAAAGRIGGRLAGQQASVAGGIR